MKFFINLQKKRRDSVIIIQRNCHNWLWKPICRDNTIGINCRLSMEALKDILV
jgi:hypothetical protein